MHEKLFVTTTDQAPVFVLCKLSQDADDATCRLLQCLTSSQHLCLAQRDALGCLRVWIAWRFYDGLQLVHV